MANKRLYSLGVGMFFVLAPLILNNSAALAQISTATITGTVRDATEAVIPGATLTVTNVDTGIARTVSTDQQGRYSVPNLAVGNYKVQATLAGFQRGVRSGITLTVGREAIVDFALSVGQVAETVTVTGEAPLVETTSTTLGTLTDQRQMADLPLNGRNFDQLTLLTPGVQQITTFGPGAFGGRGGRISVAGSRPEGLAILMDGANIQGFWNQGAGSSVAGTSLGVEAIREFETITNTYSAEFGRAGGAVINSVTKSGTNTLHGSIFEFHRNDNLDARKFFDPGKSPPEFRRNQFGVALGGPIRRNKTFFFGNYEGLREGLGITKIATVPDAATRQGLLPDPANPGSFLDVGVDPGVRPVLDLYPLPNGRLFPKDGTGEFASSRSRPLDENYFVVKMDHNLSDSDSLFGRYLFDNAELTEPFAGSSVPGFQELSQARNQYLTLEEKRILSPTLLNTFRASFVRTKHGARNLSGFAPLQFFPGSGRQVGTVNIGTLSSMGASVLTPFQFVVNTFSYADDVYYTRGAHTMKFGAEIQRLQTNYFLDFFSGGRYGFNSLRDFLEKKPFSFIGGVKFDTRRGWRQTLFGFYFQDNYKVTPKLTLNLGLRYEFTTNPVEVNGKLSHLVGQFNKDTEFTPVDHVFAKNPSLRNFGPRFGFAWDPFGDQKTSIRGGFGIFYNQILSRSYAHIAFNPPFTILGFSLFPTFPNPVEKGVTSLAPSISEVTSHSIDATPYMMQYNLNIEREVFPGTVFRIGYVGSRGTHLILSRDVNAFVAQVLPDGRKFRPAGARRVNPNFGGVDLKFADANSVYHSLQISVNKTLSRGIQFQTSYTLSKSIDDTSVTFRQEFDNTPEGIGDPDGDRSMDRGLSNFDIRQNLTTNFIYNLPFDSRRWFGGWQISNIMTIRSGPPFTVVNGFDRGNTGRSGVQLHDRPNLRAGASNNPRLGSPDQWYDTSPFVLQEAGFLGDLGRNTLIGPGLVNFDFAVLKNIAIPSVSEDFAIQFRAEFFNLFNRANFAAPSQTVFTSSSGIPSASAGRITDTVTTSRQIQFGLKIIF